MDSENRDRSIPGVYGLESGTELFGGDLGITIIPYRAIFADGAFRAGAAFAADSCRCGTDVTGRPSLAFGNPDQAVAGDDSAFGGLGNEAKGDELGQMRRRYFGTRRCNRDLDQGSKLFGRQKLRRMDGHY